MCHHHSHRLEKIIPTILSGRISNLIDVSRFYFDPTISVKSITESEPVKWSWKHKLYEEDDEDDDVDHYNGGYDDDGGGDLCSFQESLIRILMEKPRWEKLYVTFVAKTMK